ncbi:MAG: molybdenum cofactor biosynthesis protein B [Xanthomonadaceae bacterium]|nr:molybdenum cofactor biosynthesis protein B [Xanthomonadaceae bacterium]
MSPKISANAEFQPLNIAQLTVSSSRGPDEDTSGDYLCERLQGTGHRLAERRIVAENLYRLRAVVAQWIADDEVQCVLISGGTGVTDHDCGPEAIGPLLDREIPGFGELFRHFSLAEIGSSTVQSRAFAGVANRTLVFALPGSTGACKTAWEKILEPQLDRRTRPCNFVSLVSRTDV